MKYWLIIQRLQFVILVLIVGLAAILRLIALTSYPAGFNADEAAIGYNAWSILHTGRDEFGHFFPVAFTSFGDYKPPLYFYLTIPFVAALGLSEWAVRLPSALMGVGTVFILFFLVKKMFKKDVIALTASFFLAISPWHLHFSRGGWETNLATFLFVLGVYFFLKAIENSKFWIPTALVFALSFYAYQATRVLTPVLVLVLLLLFYQDVLKFKKQVIVAGIIGFIIILPGILTFFGGGGTARFSGVSIFADLGPINQVNELRGQHENFGGRLFHNKISAYGISFLKKYSDHFSGDFLFIKGDPIPRNNIPETGVLYLFDLPFLLLGFYFLLTKREKFWALPITWLLVAPLASGLTFQSPQALRSLNMVIPLLIIGAYGFYHSFSCLFRYRVIFVVLLSVSMSLLIFNFSHYLHQYYVHNPKYQPIAFEYGFADLVSYVSSVQNNYDKIIVTDRYDQPYILFLFYLKYSPEKCQNEAKLTPRDRFGFSTVRSFGKFEFRTVDYERDSQIKNTLLIIADEEIPADANIIKKILYPNGSEAFKIVKT